MRWLVRFSLLLVVLAGLVLIATLVWRHHFRQEVADLQLGQPAQLPQASQVLYADGSSAGTVGSAIFHQPLTADQMPQVAKDAVLAAEDQGFYHHGCYSLNSIVRAFVNNEILRRPVQGGSTIAQQDARLAYPQLFAQVGLSPTEQSYRRKERELVIACKLEQVETKDQILDDYLNRAYFGNNAYGIEAASQVYFGHSAQFLTAPEAATLASTLTEPSAYSGGDNLDLLQDKRNHTLEVMADHGWYQASSAELAQAEAAPVTRPVGIQLAAGETTDPALVDQVRTLLHDPGFLRHLSPSQRASVAAGGLTVNLTIDPQLQQLAEASLKATLNGPNDPLGAMVALDPTTGAVLASAGSDDRSFFLPAQAERQVGSAMKPFVAARYLLNGGTLSDTVPAPACLQVPGSSQPLCNDDDADHGQPSVFDVLAQSINTGALNLIQQTGAAPVAALAHQIGVNDSWMPDSPKPTLAAVPSLALGTSDLSAFQLGCAYTTFANDGLHNTCHWISSIDDASGHQIWPAAPWGQSQVLPPEVARAINAALQGAISEPAGTAHRLADLNIPLAAKTGTTSSFDDARLVAYTPQLVVSSWVGYNTPRPMHNLHGYPDIFGNTLPLDLDKFFLQGAL